jgi:hypothetical protein
MPGHSCCSSIQCTAHAEWVRAQSPPSGAGRAPSQPTIIGYMPRWLQDHPAGEDKYAEAPCVKLQWPHLDQAPAPLPMCPAGCYAKQNDCK